MLKNLEAWWPKYAAKNPKAVKDDVVRRLVGLIDERPLRRLGDGGSHGRPPTVVAGPAHPPRLEPVRPLLVWAPPSPVFVPHPFPADGAGAIGRTSGVLSANAFKWYDVETASRSDTQDQQMFSPLGAADWPGAQGAAFWVGYSRLDSSVSDFLDSPADRTVHMAVLKITAPKQPIDVRASFRTTLFVHLPNGVEILNDWGWFDDTDPASLQIDACAAVQPEGGDFPAPAEFTFASTLIHHSSSHSADWREMQVAFDGRIPAGKIPNIYVGIRVTFEGADCRVQTGFAEHMKDATFGFRHPDASGAPGLFYSYEPDLRLSQG